MCRTRTRVQTVLNVCSKCVQHVFGLSGVGGARVQNVFAFRPETVFVLSFGWLGPNDVTRGQRHCNLSELLELRIEAPHPRTYVLQRLFVLLPVLTQTFGG